MLTSDKAICEMNTGELAEEYEYCMSSAILVGKRERKIALF